MSRTAKFCIFLGGIFALAALAWMIFLPAVVGRELSSITGFDIRVAVLTADPFTGRVLVRGLAANNPPGFPTPDFVQLRELRSRVEVFPSIFSDRIVVDDLDMDVGKIVLMRRKDGKTNAGEFMAAFARRASGPPTAGGTPAPGRPVRYLVKNLRLRIDRLVIADYSGEKADERTFDLKIDQSYSDVTDTRQLLVPGVVRTLQSFGLHHDVARLLPGDFGAALAAAVGGAAQVEEGVSNAVKKAGKDLKGLFEKLEQSPKQ